MSEKRIDAYEIYCDGCEEQFTDSDFTIWVDAQHGLEAAQNCGWFDRTGIEHREPPSAEFPHGRTIVQTVELLCPSCQKCDVCKADGAYSNDDNHLVCDAHGDHEFEEAS